MLSVCLGGFADIYLPAQSKSCRASSATLAISWDETLDLVPVRNVACADWKTEVRFRKRRRLKLHPGVRPGFTAQELKCSISEVFTPAEAGSVCFGSVLGFWIATKKHARESIERALHVLGDRAAR